jgi:hypothetical protein
MQIRTFHAGSVKAFRQQYSLKTYDGYRPGLAIIFSTIDMELDELAGFLSQEGVRVFGASSCGEFVYDREEQVISDGGIVCMLMDPEPGTFRLSSFMGTDKSSFQLGQEIGGWAAGCFETPAILLLASGIETDGELLVRGVQAVAGEDISMFGGLAGDDAKFSNTAVFSDGKTEYNGAIALALDLKHYEVNGIATSGWESIGADKTVTRSRGNVVYTIDHEPALDVYKDYLNVRDEDLPGIGIEYPLLIKKPGRSDIIRAVLNVDPVQKSLIFAGSVPEGAVVTFSSSPGFEILDFTREKIREFNQANTEADLLVLFSCMARHLALGPSVSEEIGEAWNRWKIPLIGFFTYGEIGNNCSTSCDFHNQTYTLVAIKQKSHAG